MTELLRLAVVVFGAAAGYAVGRGLGTGRALLGPLDGSIVGVIVGSGLGFAAGGVLARRTVSLVDISTHALRDVSAETLLAGGVGGGLGAGVAAALCWPVLLLPLRSLSVPVFCFVVLVVGLLGERLAVARRHSVVAIIAGGRGIAPHEAVPAALRERVLDPSVVVDGRLLELVRSGFLAGRLLLPAPVVAHLTALGSPQGRRGLDCLDRLRREPDVEVEVLDLPAGPEDLPAQLVRLCLDRGATLLTAEGGLARAARLAGVAVLDLHALAHTLRPPVAVGDELGVHLVRAGKDSGQAVGFLDDGTMVVVEGARDRVGRDVTVAVSSVLVREKGRIVFGETAAAAPVPLRPPVPRPLPAARVG